MRVGISCVSACVSAPPTAVTNASNGGASSFTTVSTSFSTGTSAGSSALIRVPSGLPSAPMIPPRSAKILLIAGAAGVKAANRLPKPPQDGRESRPQPGHRRARLGAHVSERAHELADRRDESLDQAVALIEDLLKPDCTPDDFIASCLMDLNAFPRIPPIALTSPEINGISPCAPWRKIVAGEHRALRDALQVFLRSPFIASSWLTTFRPDCVMPAMSLLNEAAALPLLAALAAAASCCCL